MLWFFKSMVDFLGILTSFLNFCLNFVVLSGNCNKNLTNNEGEMLKKFSKKALNFKLNSRQNQNAK